MELQDHGMTYLGRKVDVEIYARREATPSPLAYDFKGDNIGISLSVRPRSSNVIFIRRRFQEIGV